MAESFGDMQRRMRNDRADSREFAAEQAEQARARELARAQELRADHAATARVAEFIARSLLRKRIAPTHELLRNSYKSGLLGKKDVTTVTHEGWALGGVFGRLSEASRGSDQHVKGALLVADNAGEIITFERDFRVGEPMRKLPAQVIVQDTRYESDLNHNTPSPLALNEPVPDYVKQGLVTLATVHNIELSGF